MADIFDRVVAGPGGCWIWTGAVKSNGYGNVGRGRRTVSAHRAAWESTRGLIPAGLCVLHQCDVRRCVRPHPEHLHLGTSSANSAEMVARGRYRGPARLGPTERRAVLDACASGATQRDVATRFGISQGTVSNIVRGRHTAMGDARWARDLYDAITGEGT